MASVVSKSRHIFSLFCSAGSLCLPNDFRIVTMINKGKRKTMGLQACGG
jgi:hypothetical protein